MRDRAHGPVRRVRVASGEDHEGIIVMPGTLRFAALCALVALALSGCAGMGKQECRALDWRTVGYEDGAAGRGIETLTGRRQACARHGVSPDLDAYRAGRDDGLVEFCQAANGFRVGARGREYGAACPDHLAPAFNDAYQAGRGLWRLETRLNEAVRGIASRRNQVEEIDRALVSTSVITLAEAKTPEERAQALLDTRALAERRGRLYAEIDALERAIPAYEADLADYRAQLVFYAY
jgi:hypothetical protein